MSTLDRNETDSPGTAVALVEAPAAAPVATFERTYTGPENSLSAFASQSSFDSAQRMAKALASSTMVPQDYRNSVANCLVAMELASRTGASVLAVMQNTHIINGRPSWAATFLIGSVNSCGRFSALRYEIAGGEDPKAKTYRVRAYATEKATGEKLVGEWIDWAMVDGEGWSKKNGSKWITLPGQMFRYRAASFWTRSYAPEISLGMHATDELEDAFTPTVTAAAVASASTGRDKLRALVDTPALQSGGVTINDTTTETPAERFEAFMDPPPEIAEVAGITETEDRARADQPVERVAAEPEPEKAAPADKAKESKDAYTQRMKTLQMRHQSKKSLTKAELDELVKYEALHEV